MTIKVVLGVALMAVGVYYFYQYLEATNWNEPPPEKPTIEHEGDDFSSTPYPSCLPYGNYNVADPTPPHALCFDGAGTYARGPATRFL
jgi:hypothetical protein